MQISVLIPYMTFLYSVVRTETSFSVAYFCICVSGLSKHGQQAARVRVFNNVSFIYAYFLHTTSTKAVGHFIERH